MSRKIKILHVIKDDKFFDRVIEDFDSDSRIESRCILVVNSPKYEFKLIENRNRVEILYDKYRIEQCFKESSYDVVFFHSIKTSQYQLFKFIPDNKLVIWWCWGFELYSQEQGMKQLISIDLLKPLSSELQKQQNRRRGVFEKTKDFIKCVLHKRVLTEQRENIIKRVDYFQPVIPLEYKMMKSMKGFHAKEFYYPRCTSSSYEIISYNQRSGSGNILIGNSASIENNHLDIWNSIRDQIPPGRKIILPLNYGYMDYSEVVCNCLTSKENEMVILKSFMPREEYFSLINSCSYAVFGVMRQQAMGNINYCISNGIKLFLYKDSMLYHFLKESGYVIFAIEDIDRYSFEIPLTSKEHEQNMIAHSAQKEYITNIYETAISEIQKTINSSENEHYSSLC